MSKTIARNHYDFDCYDAKKYPLDARFHGNLADVMALPLKRRCKMLAGFRRGLRKGSIRTLVSLKMNRERQKDRYEEICRAMSIIIEIEASIRYGLI